MKKIIFTSLISMCAPLICAQTENDDSLSNKNILLEEVMVTSRKPMLVQKDGKFIFNNLKEIMESRVVSSAIDLVLNLPLVTSTDGNTPSLAGAPLGTTIFVNGKPSQMDQQQILDYLANIPPEQVKDIEIIYNPSPKWKTQGAVINVVLKDAQRWSASGMVQMTAREWYVWTGNAGLSLTANLGKPTLNVMYSFNAGRAIDKSVSLARHTVKGDVHEIEDTTSYRFVSPAHNIYANISYPFDSINSLDVSYYGSFSPSNLSDITHLNSFFGEYHDSRRSNTSLNSVMLTYSSADLLQAGVEFRNSDSRRSDEITQIRGTETREDFAQDFRQNVTMLNAYADLSHSLPRGWTLTYGARTEYNKNTNIVTNILSSDGMEGQSSKSVTEELIASAYAGCSRGFFGDRLDMSASAKMEYYRLGDYSRLNFLPKVIFTFKPSPSHTFQAAYTTYNVFPSFWQRQDYVSYTSPYNMNLGNPGLRPARYHVANLEYMLKSRYMLSASYYRVNNFFLSQVYLSPDAPVQITQMCNIDFSTLYDLSLTIPFNVKDRLSSTLNVSGSLEQFRSSDWHGLAFDKKRLSCIVRLSNDLVLCRKPKVDVNVVALYRSPSLAGLWERTHMWMLYAGVSAAFLDERLTVEFDVNDILESCLPLQMVRLGDQWLNLDMNYYRRSFALKIAYKFNGYKDFRKRIRGNSRIGIE